MHAGGQQGGPQGATLPGGLCHCLLSDASIGGTRTLRNRYVHTGVVVVNRYFKFPQIFSHSIKDTRLTKVLTENPGAATLPTSTGGPQMRKERSERYQERMATRSPESAAKAAARKARIAQLTITELKRQLHYDPETGAFTWLTNGSVKVKGLRPPPSWCSEEEYREYERKRYEVESRRHGDKHSTAGTVSFSPNTEYLNIRINGLTYPAHRLAWFYMTGSWPTHVVDHKDGNGLNNRWENLRAATYAENRRNSLQRKPTASGLKGLRINKIRGYRVMLSFEGKKVLNERHEDLLDAVAALFRARRQYHGEFANHGRLQG